MIAKHPSRRRLVRTVDDLDSGHWIARQLPSGTSLRGYAEDHAVSALTGAVLDAIEDAGLNRTEVARLLGTTKSYVSQVLNGHNMTVKTLGALLWAAGQQVAKLETEPVAHEEAQKETKAIPVLAFTMSSSTTDRGVTLPHTPNHLPYLYAGRSAVGATSS